MKKTFIFMIVSLLVLSGCNISLFGNKNANYPNALTGTDGLVFNFLAGIPPDQVYAPESGRTSPFQAAVEMTDSGSKDITGGFLVLSVEKDYMSILSWDVETEVTPIGAAGQKTMFSIKGRSQTNPVPLKDIITINLEALPLDKQSTEHRSTITLTSCYGYMTELSKDICINTDVYNINPTEKTCTVGDISVSGGQAAPVEITQIEEKILPSQESVMPQFIIHIKNSGGGTVVDKDRISDACSSSPLSYDSYDIVNVDEVKFSGFSTRDGRIECYPDKIKIKDGEGKLRCSLKPGLLSSSRITSFTTPLYISLSYGYTQTISKDVNIRNIYAEFG